MDTQELQRLKNKYDIVGNNALLNRALETAVAVAPTDLTVLVIGETGVGKENIPKIIHQHSLRKTGKYLAINCGAIPEGTIESELFGHKKGSFTGAVEDRVGYFEEANGGTLFLDEIGELPLPFQAKLLRVLQQGEFTRVGESKVRKTDVRVVAATNVDLRHAVSQGKFRLDLYYRLNTVQITMPALRDMKDDIYLMFRKFASDYSEKYGMKKVTLTRDAIETLTHYRWPGNIRQLQNVTYAVEALESGRNYSSERVEIDSLTLSQYLPKDEENSLPAVYQASSQGGMSDYERTQISKAFVTLSAKVNDLERKLAEYTGKGRSVPAIPESSWTDAEPEIQEQEPAGRDIAQYGSGRDADIYGEASRFGTRESSQYESEEGSLSVKDSEEALIRKALQKHNGNRKKAAEELHISERTLYRKLPEEYKNQRK